MNLLPKSRFDSILSWNWWAGNSSTVWVVGDPVFGARSTSLEQSFVTLGTPKEIRKFIQGYEWLRPLFPVFAVFMFD